MTAHENFSTDKGLLYAEMYEQLFDRLLDKGWSASRIRMFIKIKERQMKKMSLDFSLIIDSDITKILNPDETDDFLDE